MISRTQSTRDHLATSQLLDDLNVKTVLTGLTQSIILHQPKNAKNALRFMYEELGRMIEEEDVSASSSQFDRAIDSCLLRMRCEYEGPDGRRKISFTRLVPLVENMQRYRAEQQAVQDMHSVFWGPSAEEQILTTAQLAETNAQRDAQDAMQQLQTRALESELHKLKAKLAATEAAATAADASLQRHFEDWQMFDGCLQALKQLDDTSLKAEFNQFADINKKAVNSASEESSTDALDRCRLSKQGLAALFASKNKTLSEGEVEELMLRIDASGDGEVDWHEFRALVRSSSELEMIFKGLPLERVLASCFARGAADDPLQPFFSQQHSDVVAGVLKAGHILVAMVAGLIKKQNEARGSQEQGAGGGKYGAELKGGTVEKFFEGVTGICGEPHPGVCLWTVCSCACVCV